MAFRPYENLIDGELDNTTSGRVTGWIRFYRKGKEPLKVTLDLEGDFHEDIRGTKIRLTNPEPKDRNESFEREGSYVDGLSEKQAGEAGDITAGLEVNGKYPYTDYPYIEWYSEINGRVVLELDPSQMEIVEDRRAEVAPLSEGEKKEAQIKKDQAMMNFMKDLVNNARESSGKRPIGVIVSGKPEAK
ncbi:hypothetical protein HYZ98_04265 [Candidatus Peregrinibacteria bacterium]|nr:hypothetical protein [Candidatus Peregrinibacteria bacterium]